MQEGVTRRFASVGGGAVIKTVPEKPEDCRVEGGQGGTGPVERVTGSYRRVKTG